MSIIIKPIITEKANSISEINNKYSFIVNGKANKIEVKKAIETKYGVTVRSVNTMNYAPKRKQKQTKKGMQRGKTSTYKKAIIQVSENDTIDFYDNQ